MRSIRLFAWALLGFGLTVFSGLAFADAPVYGYRFYTPNPTKFPWFSSPDAACSNSTNATTIYKAVTHTTAIGFRCQGTRRSDGNISYVSLEGLARAVCSDGKAPDSTKPSDQQCLGAAEPVDLCADKNPIVRRWNYPAFGPYSAPGHYSGCVVTPMEMMVCRKEASGSYCMWMVKRTGAKYSGPDTPGTGGSDAPEVTADPPVKSPPIEAPPTDDPGKGPCPAGTVHAGMSQSGIPMCIGTGSTPPAKPPQPKTETEKNETGADGSTTNTKTVITTNSDGSTTKTVTVTVTKSDGTKETSGTASTSTTPSGAAGKTDRGPEDDKYDLCKTNPNLSICREGSVTGTCGQIQCVGDAIQCATLRAAAAMECRQSEDEKALKASPLTAKGQAAIDGKDLADLPNAKNGQTVSIPGLNTTQGWLGNGAAFEDVSVYLQGQEIIVPLSKWSEYLLPFRYMLMIIASLISYRILAGAVLRD